MKNSSQSDISIILSQDSSQIPVLQVSNLPIGLLDQINNVYLLHALATNASNVLPPGKSLLSIISSRNRRANVPNSQHTKSLKDKIGDVVTRAFWDEALESLTSPVPGVQLSRLRLLYQDLRVAVAPLVPPTSPIMYTLSNPLSPTSSPLHSAASHLRGLLSVLRERCAPIRDVDVDNLIHRLRDPPPADLPQILVDTVRGIINVTDNMEEDLADFIVGTWTEQEAQQWIKREAINRERSAILDVFSLETAQKSYREWFGPDIETSTLGRNHLVNRLVGALGSPEAVSPFPPSGNMIPPHFLFVSFDLAKIQSFLQALVITASLRSLVHPVDNSSQGWLARVWTLLETEVERGQVGPAETKLLNLEDEVVQAAAASPGGTNTGESRIREAVRRTLKPQDPVFVLLQTRLLRAIRERLNERPETPPRAQIPAQMRTGRGVPTEVEILKTGQDPNILVQGFENPVLKENIKRVVTSLKGILEWMEESWGQFLFNPSESLLANH